MDFVTIEQVRKEVKGANQENRNSKGSLTGDEEVPDPDPAEVKASFAWILIHGQ